MPRGYTAAAEESSVLTTGSRDELIRLQRRGPQLPGGDVG